MPPEWSVAANVDPTYMADAVGFWKRPYKDSSRAQNMVPTYRIPTLHLAPTADVLTAAHASVNAPCVEPSSMAVESCEIAA